MDKARDILNYKLPDGQQMASQMIFSGKHSMRYTADNSKVNDKSDRSGDYSSEKFHDDMQYESHWFDEQRKFATNQNVSPSQNINIKENLLEDLNKDSEMNYSNFNCDKNDFR